MKKLFGTDGIRGVVGENLINKEMGNKIGQAMVRFCLSRNLLPKIIIGRDTRWSGEELEQAVIQGINRLGGEAVVAGVIPTPGLAFLAKEKDYSLGLMITASHNPREYNGFKIFSSGGEKLSEQEEIEIENYIFAIGDLDDDWQKINFSHDLSAREQYLNFLDSIFAEDDFSDFDVVIDCSQGATHKVAPEFFQKKCSQVEVLFGSPDGFNINDNCGSQFTDYLSRRVITSSAQVGLAFDGDGDRLIAVAENGQVLNGDQLLYIFSQYLKEKGELENDFVVSTVMSNEAFVNKLKERGIKHERTDVGDSQVFAGMKKNQAVLGGEDSGHIIFSQYHVTGDGILSALILLRALKHFKIPLSELANQFELFPKVLHNIEVQKKPALEDLSALTELIKNIENSLGENGRVLVRYSGTEPKCRVMVEAREQAQAEEYARLIADKVEELLN